MIRVTVATGTINLILLVSTLIQCSSVDLPADSEDTTTDILGKINELSDHVSSLENKMIEVQDEMLAYIERNETEDNTLSILYDNIQTEYQDKISEVGRKVMDKISAIEVIANETRIELNKLKASPVFRLVPSSAAPASKKLKCQIGWILFKESCYYISTTEVTWDSGRKQCLHLGAEYVEINSNVEFEFFSSRLTHTTWIGLTDRETEGVFRWISNDAFHNLPQYGNWWVRDNPDNDKIEEDCVQFMIEAGLNEIKFRLNDAACDRKYRYACEMKADKISI